MCGRLGISNQQDIIDLFPADVYLPGVFDELPRFNIGPRSDVPLLCRRDGQTVVQKMNWWLIPQWSKDGTIKATTFNARSETVATSRLFATYLSDSRCIVPASFFFEWKKDERKPFCFRRRDGRPLALAGIFSVWRDREGREVPTFAVLTKEANERMRPIHHRMPAILEEEHIDLWLERGFKDTDALVALLDSPDDDVLEAHAVSTYVNRVTNEGPKCIEPVE
jgi:putative SOS response-associated peptidase YedK